MSFFAIDDVDGPFDRDELRDVGEHDHGQDHLDDADADGQPGCAWRR